MQLHDWIGEHVMAAVALPAPGTEIMVAEGMLHHLAGQLISEGAALTEEGVLGRAALEDVDGLYGLAPTPPSVASSAVPIRLVIPRATIADARIGDGEVCFLLYGGVSVTVRVR